MTTLEKLFVQFFERKDWIIEQVQRQADAYTEQLASRLLIDGITPPPCLLNPRFNSRSSDPHELKKEEIISKLLLQHPRDSIRYSTGGRSLYDRPVVVKGNGQLPNEMSHAPNKGVNEPSVALACPNDDIGCSLTRVTEQDNSVNSPQNETDARISSIYAAPDTSLARIQRSKSRQKALELRTSAKAAAKSCLSKEDRTRISFTGDTISKFDFHQDKCPSEPGKCNAEEGKDDTGNGRTRDSGRLARSSTCDGKHTSLNDHSKTSDKEELDGGILVQPTGKSSQESGHADGVIERVNLLGSYGAKNSVLGKTHDTQRQNKPYSGRTTRSRGSSQQTDGLHKSLELGTSASCNPKEGKGALSCSIGDLKHGVDASNKLLKISQARSDRIGETQAICNSKDVKKPVISSNIAASRVTRSRSVSMKECPLGADHQENGGIAVGIGPIEVPVAVQPVNSGKNLDPVIMCMESDGLALKQSSDCCMLVKPKQLNFDEMDGCDSNKISGFKKRKVDGLLGPSMDSASLKYHKSSGTFFEQQLPMETVVSSQPKTLFDEDFDEETMDMNENLVVEDVLLSKKRKGQECNPSTDHKSSGTFFEQKLVMENVGSSQLKAHSHDDFEECTKDEKIDIGLDMDEDPVMEDIEHNSEFSLHDDLAVLCEVGCEDKVEEKAADVFIPVSKPSFTSCLTKQGDNGSEDNEVRPSDQDFGSSKSKELEVGKSSKLKLDSAKVNTWPQRNVEDQRNCFSDSDGFRVHTRRNAFRCELLNDLHISQSEEDIIQKIVHDEMIRDFPESLHELQPAQATTVPDETLSAAEDETSNDDVAVTVVDYSDDIMPVYEGFTIDEEVENAQDFDTLEMPSSTIKRASILEQICKSASTFKQHQVQDLHKFMPDGLVDDDVDLGNSVDFKTNISESDYDITEADYTFPKQQTFDSVQCSGTPYYWQSKSYYSSPVGKLWDRSASSSENRLSSNPELTCFPIEEDPNSNEESENDEPQENKAAANDDEVAVGIKEGIVANIEPLSGPMKYRDRCSSNSVNIEINVPRTYDKVKYQSKFHPGIIKSNMYEEEKRTPSISTRASIRRNASLQTQNSKNMRSGIKRPPLKRNNIVSNVMSFVPIVQQKQAAAVCPGKRDIKVKALEAAEAAKRREQEKENERKMRKEALRIERARIEKENAIEMVLNKKKKQEEMKKKEADVAARKKQREEDERKQMAKKRKIAEARKEQKVQHEKSRGGKNIGIAGNKKGGSENARQIKNADENGCKRNEKSVADVVQQVTSVPPEKETNILEKSPGQLGSTSQEETSYDISPYQCSDDEDEDEDELPTKKFVPTWASKRAVAVVLPLQQELDPETIFAVGAFCNMDEVLLPRRLHAQ